MHRVARLHSTDVMTWSRRAKAGSAGVGEDAARCRAIGRGRRARPVAGSRPSLPGRATRPCPGCAALAHALVPSPYSLLPTPYSNPSCCCPVTDESLQPCRHGSDSIGAALLCLSLRDTHVTASPDCSIHLFPMQLMSRELAGSTSTRALKLQTCIGVVSSGCSRRITVCHDII